MTSAALAEDAAWAVLRSEEFPHGMEILLQWDGVAAASHVRSAHYAAYRVTKLDGSEWLVRFGVARDSDTEVPDNSGFMGTSLTVPTGQLREFEVATRFSEAGGSVCVPESYSIVGEYDVLWLPFLHGTPGGITAGQWERTLSGLRPYTHPGRVPVFTNRAKSLARLSGLGDRDLAEELHAEYDGKLVRLFNAASGWSMVHGDAHSGNALNVGGQVILFDFDTACWAPSVWDYTHLINRAGTGHDTGYTAEDLVALSGFGSEEVTAALDLRRTASRIARAQRSDLLARQG